MTGLKKDICLRARNVELTLAPSLQIKPKKYSARKHVTLFLKRRKILVGQETEGLFLVKQPSEAVFKKDVMRNFAEFTSKQLCENPFFWCFLVNFAEFVRTPFLQKAPDDCFW